MRGENKNLDLNTTKTKNIVIIYPFFQSIVNLPAQALGVAAALLHLAHVRKETNKSRPKSLHMAGGDITHLGEVCPFVTS